MKSCIIGLAIKTPTREEKDELAVTKLYYHFDVNTIVSKEKTKEQKHHD